MLQYFTMRKWDFTNHRMLALNECLNDVDREEFDMNFENLDVELYFENSILGARQYCLKEDPASIPKARRTLKM